MLTIMAALVPSPAQAGLEDQVLDTARNVLEKAQRAVDTTIVSFDVPCDVEGGVTASTTLAMAGEYAYSIVGSCDYSFSATNAGCFVSVHSAYTHGCGAAPQVTSCRLDVHIDGICVGPSPGGRVHLQPGPVGARFVDDPGEFGNNLGGFRVTLMWIPPLASMSADSAIFAVDCSDPDGAWTVLKDLSAGNYEFFVVGACDFSFEASAPPGCFVSTHVLVTWNCTAFQPTDCSPDAYLSVTVLGHCVAPFSSGVVSHGGGPGNARFVDDAGQYWNNFGQFTVVVERL